MLPTTFVYWLLFSQANAQDEPPFSTNSRVDSQSFPSFRSQENAASSSATPTEPPRKTSATPTSSAIPLTTSVSDGKSIVIPLAAAVAGVVVLGGLGGGFAVLGTGPAVAVPAGSAVELTPNDDSGSNDPPEVKTLSMPSFSLTNPTVSPTTSSASTSTSQPGQNLADYVIYLKPEAGNDPAQKADFEAFITPLAEPGTLESPGDLVGGESVIYVLKTTADNASKIRSDSRVDLIEIDFEYTFELPMSQDPEPDSGPKVPGTRFENVIVDWNAYRHLSFLSMPPALSAAGDHVDDMPGYAYPKEAGEGVTVYIVDSGANPVHNEFKNAPGTKRWLFATDDTTEGDDKEGHGSCVQSLINGPLFGAAKKVDIVIVKLGEKLTTSAFLTSFLLIHNDVVERGLQGRAVVNFSTDLPVYLKHGNRKFSLPPGPRTDLVPVVETLLKLLIAEDVVIVGASGNNRQNMWDGTEFITQAPAYFAKELDVIAVGAVDKDGKRTHYSQGLPEELDASAIGKTLCAAGYGQVVKTLEGTSFAAPVVSGMIAVLLSQPEYRERLQVPGKVAANVKKLVRELSYYRSDGGDTPVAWNGLDVFSCESSSGRLGIRDQSCAVNMTTSKTSNPLAPTPAPPLSNGASPPPGTTSDPSVPVTSKVKPVPCYNFDVNAYGYCCQTPDDSCQNDSGRCWLPFYGEGVGGGGVNQVPVGARCPPPDGAKHCLGTCDE